MKVKGDGSGTPHATRGGDEPGSADTFAIVSHGNNHAPQALSSCPGYVTSHAN